MLWVIIAAGWYFIGMMVFYHWADFSDPSWWKWYYLWDKSKDLFFAGIVAFQTLHGKYFKIIFYFCIIRLLWEIIARTISVDFNNSEVIDWLFVGFLLIWMIQMLIEIREWRKLK